MYKKIFILSEVTALLTVMIFAQSCQNENEFTSDWPSNVTRTWIGPEFWANPLQDWQLNDGRIECISSGGDRNVFLLTHELQEKAGTIDMLVRIGRLEHNSDILEEGWVGFKLGIRGKFDNYKDSAIRGDGLRAGITTDGRLFIHNMSDSVEKIQTNFENITLGLKANPDGEKYSISLSVYNGDGNPLSQFIRRNISADWLHGGVALVCSRGTVIQLPDNRSELDYPTWGSKPGTERGGNVRFWFEDWRISGTKVSRKDERVFGPILFSQYTLSDRVLKLTAQMAPVGSQEDKKVSLQVMNNHNDWFSLGTAPIDTLSRTATFRIEDWDTSKDLPYRLEYDLAVGKDKYKTYYQEGLIRKEPWDKPEIVIAGFTGNNDLGFPNVELVNAVRYHDPDILFFSGDQIYEGVAGYGIQRLPLKVATLDYLRKWFLYGWAYGDLLRDRPSVAIPDDHDVYHGNIWGAGGRATPKGLQGPAAQDEGGYRMLPEWVNMVQRTQTSHLPDPYDPTPVEQGIGVYYCAMNYAGVSFAVIEDRKFKSAPKKLLAKARVWNGWAQNRQFNAEKEADVPGAVLLGRRQLQFLDHWARDWSSNAWMKVVLSQTVFSNVATLPEEEANSDRIVPRLRILNQGDYPPNDIPVSDMDSNGWPQSGRNRALRAIRRCFALHIAGDQHLGSTIQYGIDDWQDASFAFCVPAISNVWPRRWFPVHPGKNRQPGSPKYSGDYKDGFGNKMTVHAVSNPSFTGKKPSILYDRATGYGIVRLNRKTRDIIIECWPRWVDPSNPDARQYEGWPVKLNQLDNYGREAKAWLPTLKIRTGEDYVIQVIKESNGETVYSLRPNSNSFQPKVFASGLYTIIITQPETGKIKKIKNIIAQADNQNEVLEIAL